MNVQLCKYVHSSNDNPLKRLIAVSSPETMPNARVKMKRPSRLFAETLDAQTLTKKRDFPCIKQTGLWFFECPFGEVSRCRDAHNVPRKLHFAQRSHPALGLDFSTDGALQCAFARSVENRF
jgi:hypothetical protein